MTASNQAHHGDPPPPDWGPPDERAGGQVLVRRAPGAVELSFNRPGKHNSFTDAMYAALLDLCAEVAGDRSVRVVVVRGEGGRAFAAGNDISSFLGFTSGAALDALPQLTIAAIDGICVGGGLAVATMCDLRICTPASRFGYPIARTLGNALSAPIVLRCAAVFGDPVTREMLLASRLVTAERAYAVGAVLSVVAPEDLEAEVWSVIEGVRLAAPLTLETTKAQLRDGVAGYDPAADDARLEAAYGSRDFSEGVRAFLAKEKPAFGG